MVNMIKSFLSAFTVMAHFQANNNYLLFTEIKINLICNGMHNYMYCTQICVLSQNEGIKCDLFLPDRCRLSLTCIPTPPCYNMVGPLVSQNERVCSNPIYNALKLQLMSNDSAIANKIY